MKRGLLALAGLVAGLSLAPAAGAEVVRITATGEVDPRLAADNFDAIGLFGPPGGGLGGDFTIVITQDTATTAPGSGSGELTIDGQSFALNQPATFSQTFGPPFGELDIKMGGGEATPGGPVSGTLELELLSLDPGFPNGILDTTTPLDLTPDANDNFEAIFKAFVLSQTPFETQAFLAIDDLKVQALPEPSEWMLTIAGFALLGAALRRRRMAPRRA